MAYSGELASFVKKFENLWQCGRNATLHLETKAGNAYVNLSLDLGCAQDQYGYRAGNTSRQRRKSRRAAERLASGISQEDSIKAGQAAKVVTGAEEAKGKYVENVKSETSDEIHFVSLDKPNVFECEICERKFDNLEELRVHVEKHENDTAEYEFTMKTHKNAPKKMQLRH